MLHGCNWIHSGQQEEDEPRNRESSEKNSKILELKADAEDVGVVHFLPTRGRRRIVPVVVFEPEVERLPNRR